MNYEDSQKIGILKDVMCSIRNYVHRNVEERKYKFIL